MFLLINLQKQKLLRKQNIAEEELFVLYRHVTLDSLLSLTLTSARLQVATFIN